MEDVHAVNPVELAAGPPDVRVDELRRAERPQRELQRLTDVEADRRGADAAGDVRIPERCGGRLEEVGAGVIGEPGVLVPQLILAVAETTAAQHLVDGRAPTFALDEGEHQAGGEAARLPWF